MGRENGWKVHVVAIFNEPFVMRRHKSFSLAGSKLYFRRNLIDGDLRRFDERWMRILITNAYRLR